jgi:hypothetical protein
MCSTFKKFLKLKSVTAGLGTACPRRRTGEPIIYPYYYFALKGGTNLYGEGIITSLILDEAAAMLTYVITELC